MSYLINNQQKVNEIVFATRNKNYGAYVIRSSYGNTVLKSLAFMVLGFGTMISLAFYFSNRPDGKMVTMFEADKEHDSVYVIPFINEPPKQEQQNLRAEQAPVGHTEEGLGTVVNETATVTSENTTSVSSGPTNTTTSEGPAGTSTTVSTGSGTATGTFSTLPSETVVIIPDSFPEFEGGMRGLNAFLASQLKYPGLAYQEGKEGVVYVKFVVDQQGKVGSLSLLNNVGYGLDEEAMRVVAMIPKFKKPGRVNGQAVKVYYQVPIKFKIR